MLLLPPTTSTVTSRLRKPLELPDMKVKTALDSFIRTLEIMGEWLDLDYLHEYDTLVDFIRAIQEKVRSKESQASR
jgi:hypothetical protein